MKNKRAFLRCDVCGNFLAFIEDSGATPVCCGQPMTVLTANTSDGAHEKHVPVATREGDTIKVTVGSVLHPATDPHHICWIAVTDGLQFQRVNLSHTEPPEAVFRMEDIGTATVYAYCNLHGLWASEV